MWWCRKGNFIKSHLGPISAPSLSRSFQVNISKGNSASTLTPKPFCQHKFLSKSHLRQMWICVLFKVLWIFVDRVVCQVNEIIPNMFWVCCIQLCSKPVKKIYLRFRKRNVPRQAFFVDIDPQWVDACNKNINSQVKLATLNEQGLLQVSLNAYLLGCLCDFLKLIDYWYPLSTGEVWRLDDPKAALFFFHLLP